MSNQIQSIIYQLSNKEAEIKELTHTTDFQIIVKVKIMNSRISLTMISYSIANCCEPMTGKIDNFKRNIEKENDLHQNKVMKSK